MHKLLIELKDHNKVVRRYRGQCLVLDSEGRAQEIKSQTGRVLVPRSPYRDDMDQQLIDAYEAIAGKEPEALAVYKWPDGVCGVLLSEGVWHDDGRPEGAPGGFDGRLRWP